MSLDEAIRCYVEARVKYLEECRLVGDTTTMTSGNLEMATEQLANAEANLKVVCATPPQPAQPQTQAP